MASGRRSRRQVPAGPTLCSAAMAIRSVEDLRRHLQWAVELEHATLPPYLTALYSIKDGHNREAVEVIHSVFLEEMLH